MDSLNLKDDSTLDPCLQSTLGSEEFINSDINRNGSIDDSIILTESDSVGEMFEVLDMTGVLPDDSISNKSINSDKRSVRSGRNSVSSFGSFGSGYHSYRSRRSTMTERDHSNTHIGVFDSSHNKPDGKTNYFLDIQTMEDAIRCCIVIPFFNEEKQELKRTLESIWEQEKECLQLSGYDEGHPFEGIFFFNYPQCDIF